MKSVIREGPLTYLKTVQSTSEKICKKELTRLTPNVPLETLKSGLKGIPMLVQALMKAFEVSETELK